MEGRCSQGCHGAAGGLAGAIPYGCSLRPPAQRGAWEVAMPAPRPLPRFIPTLTDVVHMPPPVVAQAAAAAPDAVVPELPAAAPPSESVDVENAVAQRVQTLLRARLDQAVHQVLDGMQPLVREAVAQALAEKLPRESL